MKIGFVLDDTLDTPDGVQQYILTLGSWMLDQGHEVHYLVGQTARADLPGIHSLSRNIAVRFNGNRMSMPLPVDRRKISNILQAENFDVLHVQMPYSPFMAHQVISCAPEDTAIVATFHIAPHSKLVTYATHALAVWTRSSLRRIDKAISVSSAASDFALATYKLPTEIIPCVVKIANFAAVVPFLAPRSAKTIVFLGRLVPRKGCQLLLQAIVLLLSTHPDAVLKVYICGKGPLETELKAYAASHGLLGIVNFVGFVSDHDKARYLKSADLTVFPSSGGESFGIVLIEAMAANSAVVLGAANDGYRTVLAPYPALLFDVGDAPGLAQKIFTFISDDATREAALEWQRSYVPQFDVAVVGSQLIDVYASVVAEKSKQT